MVTAAQADLAARLKVPTYQVDVLGVRAVTWPDASLGCPKKGMFYAQMPQQGYVILLGVGKEVYSYHGSKTQPPFLCEQNTFTLPTTKADELVPPDNNIPDNDIT